MENKTIKYIEQTGMKGIWTFTVRDPESNIVSQQIIHNIIPTVSREQIAKALAKELSAIGDIEISHQELGSGSTAPANGDTGLETPTGSTRKILTSSAAALNQLNITAFWAAGEATGTHSEFAVFMKGTLASNSGVIFNRILISVTVLAANSLTVDGTVTIT